MVAVLTVIQVDCSRLLPLRYFDGMMFASSSENKHPLNVTEDSDSDVVSSIQVAQLWQRYRAKIDTF